MPELPEVEVTRRGIVPHIEGHTVSAVVVRQPSLRWPIPADLEQRLVGARVERVDRRGKFLLLHCTKARSAGVLLIHLGMSGTLQIVSARTALKSHDHVDIAFGRTLLRFNDPRRFGAILWHDNALGDVLVASSHLRGLGVEPLEAAFAGELGGVLLYERSRGRELAIKQLLLAGQVVVGVGNIYASESLFGAGIHPATSAGRISRARYQRLAQAIRLTMAQAIEAGGSTLRDFVASNGAPGYFQDEYFVYGREGEACRNCGARIRQLRQGQRASFYCPNCQRR